jgi:hypothetical protein
MGAVVAARGWLSALISYYVCVEIGWDAVMEWNGREEAITNVRWFAGDGNVQKGYYLTKPDT